MRLTFIGSGSAFTVGGNNYHSNMLLENDKGKKLLIDCGSDARLALKELGLSYRDIEDVYISHLHSDHCGGLEWLAFSKKFDPECNKPNLYICERLIKPLWTTSLAGGLSSLQTEIATLSSYFHVHPIKENKTFIWNELELRILQTIHVISGFKIVPSFGLLFTVNNLNIFLTTDMAFCPVQMKSFYEISDIIFHDCETSPRKSTVHAHYEELLTLPEQIRKKIWLYHYQPGTLPDAVKDGFRGFVTKGQCFDFNDKNLIASFQTTIRNNHKE